MCIYFLCCFGVAAIESIKDDATMMRNNKFEVESQSKRTVMDFLTLKRSSDEEQRAFLEKDFREGENFIGSSTHICSPNYDKKQKQIITEVTRQHSKQENSAIHEN